MRSPMLWCFSPLTMQVTSPVLSCLSTGVSRRYRPRNVTATILFGKGECHVHKENQNGTLQRYNFEAVRRCRDCVESRPWTPGSGRLCGCIQIVRNLRRVGRGDQPRHG